MVRQIGVRQIGVRQCGLCQPMESKAESLCCLDTNEVPDDYFEGY